MMNEIGRGFEPGRISRKSRWRRQLDCTRPRIALARFFASLHVSWWPTPEGYTPGAVRNCALSTRKLIPGFLPAADSSRLHPARCNALRRSRRMRIRVRRFLLLAELLATPELSRTPRESCIRLIIIMEVATRVAAGHRPGLATTQLSQCRLTVAGISQLVSDSNSSSRTANGSCAKYCRARGYFTGV